MITISGLGLAPGGFSPGPAASYQRSATGHPIPTFVAPAPLIPATQHVLCPDGSVVTDPSLCPVVAPPPPTYVAPTLTLCPDGFTQVTDPSQCPMPTAGSTVTVAPTPDGTIAPTGLMPLLPVAAAGLSTGQVIGIVAAGLALVGGIAYAISRSRTTPAAG